MSSQVKLYIADVALPLESASSAFSADKGVHVGQENEKSGEPRLESDLEKISPYRDRKSGTITRENGRKSFLSKPRIVQEKNTAVRQLNAMFDSQPWPHCPYWTICRSGFAAINAPLPTWQLITWNVLWRGLFGW